MKRLMFYICGLVSLLGCEHLGIETYKADNYIQFVNSFQDSSTLSFLFYPGKNEIEVPFIVEMANGPCQQELNYKVVVDKENTTAEEGVHFDLPQTNVFKIGAVKDTLLLKLYRRPEMKEKAFRVVLRVEQNEWLQYGQPDYLVNILWIHDKISKPEWWVDNPITWSYLGEYSDKKYQLFIDVTGVADLTGTSDSEKRAVVLKFYYYLEQEKAKGNIIREEDGTEMTVEIIG